MRASNSISAAAWGVRKRKRASGTASTSARRRRYSCPASCTSAERALTNASLALPSYPSNAMARSMSPMTGARPNCAARFPATSAITATASSRVLEGPEAEAILRSLGEGVRVADVGSRAPEQCTIGLARVEIAGAVGTPVGRGRQRHARRQVLLLAGPCARIGRDEGIGRHESRHYLPAVNAPQRPARSARSRPK